MADGTTTARARRARKTVAPTTPDPIEIAMEAEASGRAPDAIAREVLRKQSTLIGWQVANERAGFAAKLMLTLTGVGVAVALAVMAIVASRADGLVVEPFSVPPELQAQGVTGTSVAVEVLDQLAKLGRETRVFNTLRVRDSWSGETHVEIPQTGVSVDEANRLLRRWLGHQTYLIGSVRLVGGGEVELTARTGEYDILRVRGPVEQMPDLARALAEQLIREVRPAQYGRLLAQRQQYAEAIDVLQTMLRESPPREEASDAHAALGNVYMATGYRDQAAEEFRLAIALGGRGNAGVLRAYSLRGLGRQAESMDAAAAALRDAPRAPDGGRDELYLDQVRSLAALLVGDYVEAERTARALIGRRSANGGASGNGPTSGIENHILPLAGLHETTRATQELPLLEKTGLSALRLASFRTALSIRIAAQDDDWARVLQILDDNPSVIPGSHLETFNSDAWRALALAHLGRIAEARAIAATLRRNCYRCWIHRGEIAELAGDRAAADAAFAEAVRQAPRAPFAQTAWAAAELGRGRADVAIKQAKRAVRAGPNFADPQVIWAEALLTKGDAEGAAAKLRAASAHAPRWGRLYLKWGEALAAQGKTADAQAKWTATAGMDLTAAERAELARVSGKMTLPAR